MSVLRVSVPITLQRNSEGFWLEFKGDNKEALLHLGNLDKGEIVQACINGWAKESMTQALKSKRRATGLRDSKSAPVNEGDIVDSPAGGLGRGVVKWRQDFGGFVIAGPKFCTHNLRGIDQWTVIGNIFENSELL